jgi:hypothetical protein
LPMVAMVAAVMLATAGPIGEMQPPQGIQSALNRTPLSKPRIRHAATQDAAVTVNKSPEFGSLAFCVGELRQPAFAIERCLRWTHALLRH